MPKTYERNIPSPKFYDNMRVGREGYNPRIIMYYDSGGNIVHVDEIFMGRMYSQTISGSNFSQNWPNYSYKIVYDPWVETTYSG